MTGGVEARPRAARSPLPTGAVTFLSTDSLDRTVWSEGAAMTLEEAVAYGRRLGKRPMSIR